MGKYINILNGKNIGVTFNEKCRTLLEFGAIEIDEPDFNGYLPNSLVCVMDNYVFAAALYCFDESEFIYVLNNPDSRPKKWFLLDRANKYAQ